MNQITLQSVIHEIGGQLIYCSDANMFSFPFSLSYIIVLVKHHGLLLMMKSMIQLLLVYEVPGH